MVSCIEYTKGGVFMRKKLKVKRPKHRRGQSNKNIGFLFFGTFMILLFVYIFGYLDRQIMPTVIAMSELKAITVANSAISQAINDTLKEKNMRSEDLIMYDFNENGEMTSFSTNTIAINELCSDVSIRVAEQLQNVGNTKLKIPLGTLTGSRMFATFGPELKVEILPIGTAKVNYDSSFIAVGINQINYKVWLSVDTQVQIVVPLAEQQVKVNRRFTLVDKVFSGKVPPNYVNTNPSTVHDLLHDPVDTE